MAITRDQVTFKWPKLRSKCLLPRKSPGLVNFAFKTFCQFSQVKELKFDPDKKARFIVAKLKIEIIEEYFDKLFSIS